MLFYQDFHVELALGIDTPSPPLFVFIFYVRYVKMIDNWRELLQQWTLFSILILAMAVKDSPGCLFKLILQFTSHGYKILTGLKFFMIYGSFYRSNIAHKMKWVSKINNILKKWGLIDPNAIFFWTPQTNISEDECTSILLTLFEYIELSKKENKPLRVKCTTVYTGMKLFDKIRD